MSADFKKCLSGLIAFFVIAILVIAVVIPAGKEAIQGGANKAGTYASCTLAMCPQRTTTSQNNH